MVVGEAFVVSFYGFVLSFLIPLLGKKDKPFFLQEKRFRSPILRALILSE